MRQKTIFNLIILLLTAALLISCEESTGPDNGEDPKPPGYQGEIPWPSLADSPWPMYHHDPQGSGRTNSLGPQLGNIELNIDTGAEIGYAIVLGPDSTIYFTSSSLDTSETGLYAYNQDGSLKWKISSLPSSTAPLVSSDGTIYFSDWFNLYSVSSTGNINWTYDYGAGMHNSGLNITKEGNILIMTNKREIQAINSSGELAWSLISESFSGDFLTISPDGKIIYLPGKDHAMLAVNIKNPSISWRFGKEVQRNLNAAPILDSRGNIYVNAIVDTLNNGDPTMYCLTPEGEINWFLDNTEIDIGWLPAIDKNGNIYFQDDKVYSVDFKGDINWSSELGYGQFNLICDGRNNIYTSINTVNYPLYSISSEGKIDWQLSGEMFGKPAIGYKRLFIPVDKSSNFYIIN